MSRFALKITDSLWRADAECLTADPDRFDDPLREKPTRSQVEAAGATIATYCDPCPVREPCAEVGENGHATGIWGGELFTQRRGDRNSRVLIDLASA